MTKVDYKMKDIKKKIFEEGIISNEFLDIVHENMKPMKEFMTYYRCAIMEIETKFNVLNEEFSLQYDRNPIEHIKTRLKSTESIIKKINRKGLDFSIETVEKHIKDIAGVRVICSFPEDIYKLAECLLNQDDVKLIEKKDYIVNPKKSGYRSLHLIVEVPIFLQNGKKSINVEVQLRTIAMDFWASLEHKLRYKKNIDTEETEIIERELLICSEISADLDKRMEGIRNRIESKL
jgi:putative GTP pyrophosphokinase